MNNYTDEEDNIFNIVKNDFKRLYDIWEEMGYNENTISSYSQEVRKHIKELMNEMIIESEEKRNHLLQSVQHLMELASTLAKELQLNEDPGRNPEYERMPLIEVKDKLRSQVQDLQIIKDRRLEYFKELRMREQVVCKKLGIKPIALPSDMPSEEDLKQFSDYLEIQEREKARLDGVFNDLRKSVIKLMDELNISPSLGFERLVCNDHDNFVYTSDNISKLREMRNDLKVQVENAKQQADEKREELKILWNYLDESKTFCRAFLADHADHSVTTITALNTEIKRCKEKRSQNIAKYVSKAREDLRKLWDLCRFSEEQKKSFLPFISHTYTEDLLTLHELETEKLRKFYNTNKKIFDLLQEWETVWEKMKEMDQRANDPVRFHNRGGQLLTEEKERKNISKKLPKVEELLLQADQEFRETNGVSFTINGIPIDEYLDYNKAEYEKEKENMKIARKQAKEMSGKRTPLSTSKRTPSGMSIRVRTPLTAGAKRKLPYDSSPNSTAGKRRNMSVEKNRTTVIASKVRRSGKMSKKALMNLSRSNTPKSRIDQKSKTGNRKGNLSISSYVKFQEHLEDREELRSSTLSENLLENIPDKTPMKTPVRTPAKPLRRNLLAGNTPTSASTSRTLRSPRVMKTPRLTPAPSNTHVIF